MIKSLVVAGLILALLIPTAFISNLVDERHDRQKEVVQEVSSKWAAPQTLVGPYIYLPIRESYVDTDKKTYWNINHFNVLPDNLEVNGKVLHEMRKRSIYQVILYKANLDHSGKFIFTLPKETDLSQVQWSDARICFGISDFKGIEEKLVVNLAGKDYELSPGLPAKDISDIGLSASISLSADQMGQPISFRLKVGIKGSGPLKFAPFAGDSHYALQSDWPSPSFDGNILPSTHNVNDSGYTAQWKINKANLPYGTLLKDFKFSPDAVSFGVTMIQPADSYARTDRSVKYAILFIGLTLSLFFIIELMQKKPVHTVQYVLIGLALVIFYTLLLSISEYINFNWAYLIAALATVLLITAYAKSHFKSYKTASIFFVVLSLLYTFTFVLIQLEDAALLIGSIGLFIILALAMYASRKVNWYGGSSDQGSERNVLQTVVG